MREAFVEKDMDRLMNYAAVCFDVSIPYWGTHIINIYEKYIWKGIHTKYIFHSEQQVGDFRFLYITCR